MFPRSADALASNYGPFVENSLGHLDDRMLADIGFARTGWAGNAYVVVSTSEPQAGPRSRLPIGIASFMMLMRR